MLPSVARRGLLRPDYESTIRPVWSVATSVALIKPSRLFSVIGRAPEWLCHARPASRMRRDRRTAALYTCAGFPADRRRCADPCRHTGRCLVALYPHTPCERLFLRSFAGCGPCGRPPAKSRGFRRSDEGTSRHAAQAHSLPLRSMAISGGMQAGGPHAPERASVAHQIGLVGLKPLYGGLSGEAHADPDLMDCRQPLIDGDFNGRRSLPCDAALPAHGAAARRSAGAARGAGVAYDAGVGAGHSGVAYGDAA